MATTPKKTDAAEATGTTSDTRQPMAVPAGGLGLSSVGAGARMGGGGHAADALSALTNLGFRPADASVAVAGAVEELGEDASLDALVRLALKKVGR